MFARKFLSMLGLLALAVPLALAWAGDPRTPAVAPIRVRFSAASLPLKVALKELQDQTGNVVKDLRTNTGNPSVPTKPGEFWPTLDALCEKIGTGFNAYALDHAIALVDTPYRKNQPKHYSGIFRFAVRSIDVIRDDETEAHQCKVVLDTAWEPRFKALFVNLEHAEVAFAGQSEKLDGDGSFSVAGSGATQNIKIVIKKAPPRGTAKLDSLKGAIRVIGVPSLVDFAFAKLKDKSPIRTETQAGVKVSVTLVEVRQSRWTVELATVHPEGALVSLQSFEQPVLDRQSRVWLTWGIDPKTKKPYELDWREYDPQETKVGTKIQYHFRPRGETPLPPPGADVTLRYRTPSRVVAFTVPFAFRDLPLP